MEKNPNDPRTSCVKTNPNDPRTPNSHQPTRSRAPLSGSRIIMQDAAEGKRGRKGESFAFYHPSCFSAASCKMNLLPAGRGLTQPRKVFFFSEILRCRANLEQISQPRPESHSECLKLTNDQIPRQVLAHSDASRFEAPPAAPAAAHSYAPPGTNSSTLEKTKTQID